MLVYYSALGAPVTLSLTVRAFPEITGIEWSKQTRDHIVTSLKTQAEVFKTQLNIASVMGSDYGDYTVTVNNGVKQPAIFNIELRQTGREPFLFKHK